MESARAQWGGFRRGKKGVQIREPLRQELGPRRWAKEMKTWMLDLTRRPEMGGGLMRLTPRYRRASLLGPQEGFENGFQNEAKLGGSGGHFG